MWDFYKRQVLQLYEIDRRYLSLAVQYYAQTPELWAIEYN